MKKNFFSVIIQSQTYLNIFYSLLSFPLGIIYFVFLVTGISLGLGLAVTLFGIPILVGMIFAWKGLGIFERQLAVVLLNINIPFKKRKALKGKFWKKVKKQIAEPFTWRSLLYLFIKFPLGIMSFVIVVTLISVSFSLISAPVLYYLIKSGVMTVYCTPENFCFLNLIFAILTGIVGIFLLFVSLHAFNGLANVSGRLAKEMLKK